MPALQFVPGVVDAVAVRVVARKIERGDAVNSIVVNALVVIGVLGVIIGIALGIASVVFEVKVDPRVQEVYDALPHFNCGACGYPGCQGMAQGLIKSEVPISRCKPSKPDRREKIKAILDSHGIENSI